MDPEALDSFFPHFLCAHDPERGVLRFGALLPEPLEGIPQAAFREALRSVGKGFP